MDSVYEVTSNLSLHHFFFFFVCVQKSDIKMFKFSESNIHYTALIFSFPDLEPVCCSMSSSNCCFLTCIQASQEAGQVVWYSHLFQNFPQFLVIHTVKGFGIVNKAEIDVFLELSCFFDANIQWMLAIRSLVPLLFLKPAWTSGSSRFTYCWRLAWRILSITLVACEMSTIVPSITQAEFLGITQ